MASAYKKRQWWQEAQGVSFVRPAPRAHSYVPCCSHEVGRRWRIIEGVPFFTHRRATLENGGAWFWKALSTISTRECSCNPSIVNSYALAPVPLPALHTSCTTSKKHSSKLAVLLFHTAAKPHLAQITWQLDKLGQGAFSWGLSGTLSSEQWTDARRARGWTRERRGVRAERESQGRKRREKKVSKLARWFRSISSHGQPTPPWWFN